MPENALSSRCPKCGTATILADADALCPGCLLATALHFGDMENEDTGEISLGTCGSYQLEKIIGRGGHGIVFLARADDSTEPVAIKMLASAQLAGPDELRRFRLEIESVLKLEHPHIVRIIAVGENDGSPYYVMQYASNRTLADCLFQNGFPSTSATALALIPLFIKVVRAVHFAHEHGILHRDLKPANILLDAHGEPQVSDFGLARMALAPPGATMTGAALGSPSYMAPEQAAGISITTAADLYSLGAILYHILTGKPPFTGGTPLDVLRQVTTQDVPDPRASAAWIDQDLAMICLTALHRQPARRYATSASFADDLERWQRKEAVIARPLGFFEKSLKACRRHPITATLGIAATVAALVLIGMFMVGSVLLQKEKDQALRQAAIARTKAAEATRARNQFQLNSYAADLYLGFDAIQAGHLGQARTMLANHLPKAGENDLRGYEWHWLAHLCTGDDLQVWRDFTSAATAIAIDPSGKTLASAGREGKVIFRSFPDGEMRMELPSTNAPSPLGEVSILAWSHDGTNLLTAGPGNDTRIWKMPEGELIGQIAEHKVAQAEYDPNGKFICLLCLLDPAAQSYQLRIYDAVNLTLARTINDLQRSFTISPNGQSIAVLPHGSTQIAIHSLSDRSPTHSFETNITLRQISYSPDGKSIFGNINTGILIAQWDLPEGNRSGQVYPIAGTFCKFTISSDGQRIASTNGGQNLYLQSLQGTSTAVILRGHEDGINDFEFSPDGHHLFTASIDQTSRRWIGSLQPAPSLHEKISNTTANLNSTQPLSPSNTHGVWHGSGLANDAITFQNSNATIASNTFPGPPENYTRLVTSDDPRFLGAFSAPRNLWVFDTSSGRWAAPIRLTQDVATAVCISHIGGLVASGGDDNTVRVRTLPEGRLITELRGHQGRITSIAFSHDGKTLVTSSLDTTTRLWQIATWRELGILHRGENFQELLFTAGDRLLLGKTTDGMWREFRGKTE